MNVVLHSTERTLLSVSAAELKGIAEAIDLVCSHDVLPENEFQARMGISRELLIDLRRALLAPPHPAKRALEQVDAWADQGCVMVRAITVFGDPVELDETEAHDFNQQWKHALAAAS